GTKNIWGGFGYTSASWGDALTPSGMVQLDFVGATTSDARWVRCERWFSDGWKDVGRDWLDRNNVYAYYAFAKAMRLALPNPVVQFSAGTYAGFDWYRGGAVAGLGVKMGLAEKISNQLIGSGYWNYYGGNLGTAWCVIILRPVLFAEAPIACFDADPNPNYADRDINFDPRCSGHSAPNKDISDLQLFEWDWDNDGTYDVSTATPTVVTHQFSTPTIPAVFPVTLRVTDGDDNTATYAMDIHITNPPHPPVSLIDGPMMVSLCAGDTLKLDGSNSYDPDEGTHEAGCPACPNDTITKYEWDLDGAPFNYTGPTGETVDLGTGFTTYFGSAGMYDVGLKVTDNSALSYPTGGGVDLTDEGFEKVYVYNCFNANLSVTAGCGYVSLTWNDVGADKYTIYLSTKGPNTGFADVWNGTDTSKTMGSFVMGMDTWYRVMAMTGTVATLSEAKMVNADPALCNPVADAGGPYDVCTGDVVTLDGSGSVALLGNIIAWEWDLDNDGAYDDAFGQTVQHTWNTPGTYPVGLKVVSSDSFVLNDTDMVNVTVNKCLITIGIDIYPNRVPNRVMLSRNYTLYVAALGSATFDATSLNSATVKFGKTGTEASPVRAPLIRDLNGDGYLDAMYGFMTNSCGFALGDTEGILTGKLQDGTDAVGTDSVLVMP
ncbi:MAG: PKD domain-containing protein, partial [Planctomycetota bacterium]